MTSFLISLGLFYFSVYRLYFLASNQRNHQNSLLYQLQYPLSLKKYKLIFLGAATAYFIFFGFLSNIFIYFIDEHTIFSFVPLSNPNHNLTNESEARSDHVAEESSIVESPSETQSDQHKQHINHQGSPSGVQNQIFNQPSPTRSFPDYQLIICCNHIGYVPMLILKITENFSILIIPLNLLIATTLSVLVGLNISLNIYLLSNNKSIKLSRKNYFGLIGISSGLFVGCPTCTGSLFYSLVGFSSLVLFTSLNFYQILFIAISIPMLLISLFLMMKMLQKSFIDSCKL